MAKSRQSRGRRSDAPKTVAAPQNDNVETLRQVLELFKQSGLKALAYEDADIIVQLEAHSAGGEAVSVVRAPAPVAVHAPAVNASTPPAVAVHQHVQPTHTEAPKAQGGHIITSPFVGTFYRAPSPTSAPFVNQGATVKKGQTLCIIEAMKLMNEIEADEAGSVAEIYVENGAPVEFGQKLFRIIPA